MRNILLLILILALASCAKAPSNMELAQETGVDVSSLPVFTTWESGDEMIVYDSGQDGGDRIAGITFSGSVTEFLTGAGTFVTNDTMTYPGLGIPWSTGSAWGTSYSLTGLKDVLDDETWTFVEDVTFNGSIISTAANGARKIVIANNSSISPAAASMEIYPEANVWKGNVNGTERIFVLLDSDGTTLTIADLVVTDSFDGPAIVSVPKGIKLATDGYTIGTTKASECYGGVIYMASAGTINACDDLADGMSFTVITVGNYAVLVDPQWDDLIIRDGTTQINGQRVLNTSTTGDKAEFWYYDATGWYCASNGWSNGT